MPAVCLAIALIVTSSCKEEPCYKYDVTELHLSTAPDEFLRGTLLPVGMEDVSAIYCIDSLLLVNSYDYIHYYTVYNINTFDSIMSFGRKGRAGYEFTEAPGNSTKQVYQRNGDWMVPLMSGGVSKEVNLSKTIEKGTTVVERTSRGVPYYNGTAVFYGDDYEKLFMSFNGESSELNDQGRLPAIVYIDENDSVEEFSVYSRFPHNNTFARASDFYSGNIYKQPEGSIVAQPLYQMSYILFYDVEHRKYHAVHISGARSFEDGIPEDEEEQNSMAFQDDAAFSEDYLFVHYWGDYASMLETDPEYKGRILQLDWNGNLIKSYILHDWINRLAYDSSTHILYGANFWSGEFYSFGEIQ